MFLLYFFLWIIFCGNITVEICIIGLVVAAALFWFTCRFMDYSIRKEVAYLKKGGILCRYLVRLVVEIIKSNFATAKVILSEDKELEPTLAGFDTELKTPLAKTLLANAITLTPGTITVDVDENHYLIHALDKDYIEGFEEGAFLKLAVEFEEGLGTEEVDK